MADEVDREMRQVLLQLELTSNGATLNYEGSSSGGYYGSDAIPALGEHDAPHLFWARMYARADTRDGRARVLELARSELKDIMRSRGDPSKEETKEALAARIVEHGEGEPVDVVAVWARCTVTFVRTARREAGREEERGKTPINGRELGAGLADEIRRRVETGSSARQVAKALSLSYSTVLRALGQKQ